MRNNYPALTAVRGLAAWWVVVYHFRDQIDFAKLPILQEVANHGYLAVDLFFIMSGFVIALNYADALQRPAKWVVARFLGFRLARIYPLHLVILLMFIVNPLAIVLFSGAGSPGGRYDLNYFIQSLFLVQNWGFNSGPAWNIPAWSISTEWGAYLVFPLLAKVLSRVTNPIRAVSAFLVMMILVIGCGYLAGGLGEDIGNVGLLRCLLEFMLGATVFRVSGMAAHWLPNATLMFVAGSFALVTGLMADWPDYTFAPLALFLILVGLLEGRSPGVRMLSGKVLLYIGEISYSTYLIHYFVKDWSKFLLVGHGLPSIAAFTAYILITAMASVVLYHSIELPGRRLGRAWTQAWVVRQQRV